MNDANPDSAAELDLLLGAAARYALGPVDGTSFVRWFAKVAPVLCPEFVSAFPPDEEGRTAALHALGRLLWNRMPLPDNGYRPRPLPKPERNAPCPCGSGRKYKHCCATIDSYPDPFQNVSLLRYVLDQHSRAELQRLPLAGLDLEELGFIASQWLDEDRAADAKALLERLFEDVDRLDDRAQLAFDRLADCYDALGHPKKKERLIERVSHARNRTLRSAALHRRITILADRGERDEAWRLFAEAQRSDPDNPMLATLELTLLLAQRDYDRLRERGHFWIARLGRDRNHDYSDLVGYIRDLIADPVGAELSHMNANGAEILELRRLLGALPPVESHYRLERTDHEACLESSPALAAVVDEWKDVTDVWAPDLVALQSNDEDAWDSVAPALPWLESNPLAWQSFDVLDDLVLAIRSAGLMGEDALIAPLLERAVALLDATIERGGTADLALPWSFLQNRPALRLIASVFYLRLGQGRRDEAIALARRLVLTLNPNDNHGLRETLMRLHLDAGDAAAALDIADRYPDDAMVGTMFNRALALFVLGRNTEADAALREADRFYPKVLPTLVADKLKPHRDTGDFVTVGSMQEARIYRDEHRPVWEKCQALEWGRSFRTCTPRTRRRQMAPQR